MRVDASVHDGEGRHDSPRAAREGGARPMHVVLFSPIAFEDLHQRPQQLATLFVEGGVEVTYVQPLGLRTAAKRGFWHLLAAMAAGTVAHLLALARLMSGPRVHRGRARAGSPARGLAIVAGPLAMPLHRSGAHWLNTWALAAHRVFLERAVLARLPGDRPVAALVQFPLWGAVLEPGDFDAVFYDCLDDFGSFGGRNSRERLLAWERRLVDLSAAAFATAGGLESHLRSLRSHLTVHRAPNGVDLDWFRARAAESPVGRDRHEGRPVAGYVGVIGRWLDYDLLAGTLETCPEIDFVFVGPTTEGAVLERLQRHRNFRWVPRRPYAEIPGIISGFDACLIPFSEGPIARTTNPVKVFEYFALGKPVVTTAVDELREWRTGELVYWAEDLPGFSAAVRRAVHEHDPERAALRVDVARAHTWRERAAQMQSAMASVLTGGRSYDDPS